MARIEIQELQGIRWYRDGESYVVDRRHLLEFMYWAIRVSKYFTVLMAILITIGLVTSTLIVDYASDSELDSPQIIGEQYQLAIADGLQPGHTIKWHFHKTAHNDILAHIQLDPKVIPDPDPYANGFDGHGNKIKN